MEIKVFFLALILLSFNKVNSRVLEKDILITYKQELIDGKVFKHRVDIDSLNKKETFSIDNQVVTQEAFDESLLEAQKEESRRQLQSERELQTKNLLNRQKLQVKIILDELQDQLNNIQKSIKPLLDDRLTNYLAFSIKTIPNFESLKNLIDILIPEIKNIINKPIEEQDFKQLENYKESLITKDRSLRQLFADTIDKVISKADDTQLLKELLVLVS